MYWSAEHREIAQELLDELRSDDLRVVLTEAPEQRFPGHMVRTVTGENCAWYRDFCAEYVRPNRPKTLINRSHVIRALQNIINDKKPRGTYVERLQAIIEDRARVPF